MRKAGISLVVLVITIIVLIILTGTVILTGINVPKGADLAVFYNNIGQVQDAVTMKMLDNQMQYVKEGNERYKWVGIADGYTEADARSGIEVPFRYMENLSENPLVLIDANVLSKTNLSQAEKTKYFVDNKGVVYYEGFEYEGETYYNRETNAEGTDRVIVGDISGPTVTITPRNQNVYVGDTVIYDITFSEVVSGLTVEEITVVNGTKGELSGSGANYVFTVTDATIGTQNISIAQGVCQDSAGNNNIAQTSLNITVNAVVLSSIEITTPPTKNIYTVGETFDTAGMVVTGTYNNGTTKILTSSEYTVSPANGSTLTTVGTATVTATLEGDTTTVTINHMTLGELLLREGANGKKVNYGKKINYSANGVTDWRVWCRATVGGVDYTYIVATSSVEYKWNSVLPAATEVTEMTQANKDLYNIFQLGQSGYALNTIENGRMAAYLINHYGAYANTSGYVDGEGNSYVVGAIGGPTMEMLEAGWNGLYPGGNPTGKTMSVSANSAGYKINNVDYDGGFTNDNIYIPPETHFWLSSPAAGSYNALMFVGGGYVSYGTYGHTTGVCPAVCLKSNIPVSLDGENNIIMIEN